MSALQGMLEGQSVTRSPYFNEQHYNWWKNHIENYIQADDYKLWIIIENGPYILMKTTEDGKTVPKKSNELTQMTSRN